MLRKIQSPQRLVRLLTIRLDGTAGTPAPAGLDQDHCTVADVGAGEYTITLNDAAQRTLQAQITPVTTGIICRLKSASSSAITVECLDAATGATPTDAEIEILIIASDSPDRT